MAYFKDLDELVQYVLDNGFSLQQIIREAAQEVISKVLLFEAKTQIKENNEVLPEGRARLTLNGCYNRSILTSSGQIEVKVPRIDDRKDGPEKIVFSSSYLPRYLRRTKEVKDLIPWLYLKGFSTSQFSDIFSLIYGSPVEGVSSATVTKDISQFIVEHDEWTRRDLSGQKFPYIWGDGIFLPVRGEKENQAVLAIIGVDEDGRKTLLGLDSGFSENADSWRAIFDSLRRRGMENLRLTIGDGGLGLWAGLRQVYPDCAIQQC
jgi:transposase-like protein